MLFKNLLIVVALFFASLDAASLFKALPQLKKKVPFTKICNLPTPIVRLTNLEKAVGAAGLYCKNDALTSDIFGGNKPRKLEFLLGDALAKKSPGVITIGDAGSNHACATAHHSETLGLTCLCLYVPQQNTEYAQRNLKATCLTDAGMLMYPNNAAREAVLASIRSQYEGPNASKQIPFYVIPSGGSNAIGCLGFVNAAYELKEQIDAKVMPTPDIIYVTLGSKGTAAGLLLGLKAVGLKSHVVAVRVTSDPDNTAFTKLNKLFDETNDLLRSYDPTFPKFTLSSADVTIDNDFFFDGYAKVTPETARAITILENTEDIKLDGTYTGKTFAALLHAIEHDATIKDKKILFWDTFFSGEISDEAANLNYTKLNKEFQAYFDGTLPLQPDDCGY